MLVVVFFACKKDDSTNPNKIIIRDQNSVEIKAGDTIYVQLNSVHQTLIHCEYNSSKNPEYIRQIDQGDITNLDESNDLEVKSSDSAGDIMTENVEVTTDFSDSIMKVGSVVNIITRIDFETSKTIYYKVQ